MNSDLKDDKYKVPKELIEKLISTLSNIDKSKKGFNRCKDITEKGFITYPQAKKIKYELENELEGEGYEVIGGDDMLDFINLSLGERRKNVHNSKKIRQNSGEENVFKKTHTKDKTKNPTRVTKIKVATTSDDINNNRAVYEEIDRIKQLIK